MALSALLAPGCKTAVWPALLHPHPPVLCASVEKGGRRSPCAASFRALLAAVHLHWSSDRREKVEGDLKGWSLLIWSKTRPPSPKEGNNAWVRWRHHIHVPLLVCNLMRLKVTAAPPHWIVIMQTEPWTSDSFFLEEGNLGLRRHDGNKLVEVKGDCNDVPKRCQQPPPQMLNLHLRQGVARLQPRGQTWSVKPFNSTCQTWRSYEK